MIIEAEAAQHGIEGPAASTDAWPLDGPFTTFERTQANVNAYHTFVAVTGAAAAARVRAAERAKKNNDQHTIEAAAKAAELMASSLAMLYNCGEIGEVEKALLVRLAEHNAHQAEKALRWVGMAVQPE